MSYVFTILGSRPQTIFVTDKYCPQKSSKTTMTKIGNRNIAIDIQLEDIAIVLPNIVRRTNLVKMTDKYCQGKLYSRFLPNLVCVCVVSVCAQLTCVFFLRVFFLSVFFQIVFFQSVFIQSVFLRNIPNLLCEFILCLLLWRSHLQSQWLHMSGLSLCVFRMLP